MGGGGDGRLIGLAVGLWGLGLGGLGLWWLAAFGLGLGWVRGFGFRFRVQC